MAARQLRVPTSVLVQMVGDEAVLLDLLSERYYGLDDVGVRFWAALTAGGDSEAAFHELANEFDVAPETLAADLDRFVDELLASGLLEVAPDAADA